MTGPKPGWYGRQSESARALILTTLVAVVVAAAVSTGHTVLIVTGSVSGTLLDAAMSGALVGAAVWFILAIAAASNGKVPPPEARGGV